MSMRNHVSLCCFLLVSFFVVHGIDGTIVACVIGERTMARGVSPRPRRVPGRFSFSLCHFHNPRKGSGKSNNILIRSD